MPGKTVFLLGFRPFYSLAAAFAAVAVLLWLLTFTGQLQFGVYLQSVFWHSHEMVFGFLIAVMTGFLLTAVRNWTGLPTPTGTALAGMALLWLSARVLVVTGPTVLAVAVDVLFVPVLLLAVGAPIVRSRNRRNYKILLILTAIAGLHLAFHLANLGYVPAWLSRTAVIATIDVIVILFTLIGGRVIPAFTRNAVTGANPRHEKWVEIIVFAALLVIAFLDIAGESLALPAAAMTGLLVVAAVSQLFRLALWQPQLTIGNPLLWMMPVAYSWLPAALFLRALASQAVVAPGVWIHSLTVGALSGLMMAMMMRSSLGHTGRKLAASHTDMAAFLALQLAAVFRVVAGISDNYRAMIIATGVLWILAFALFLLRYLPMLTRPRVDGRPG